MATVAAGDVEKKYNNLAFSYVCDIAFNKKTLSWTKPEKRKPFEKKDAKGNKIKEVKKDDEEEGDGENGGKKKELGEHFMCNYIGVDKSGAETTGAPRIKTPKGIALTVLLVQKKDNKMRVTVKCNKNSPEEMEIINCLEKYDTVFEKWCIDSKGKQVKFVESKKNPFNETVFRTQYQASVRNEDNKKYATFTVNVPIYSSGENVYGTKFFSKGNNTDPLDVNDNNFYEYIAAGSRIKIAMTIKDHWISNGAHGRNIVANSISIVEKPPRPVMTFKQLGKAGSAIEMELYKRDYSSGGKTLDGAFTIGGSVYYRDGDGKQMPMIWQGPVMQTKWSCKSQFKDNNGKTQLVITADVSASSDTCCHAERFLKSLQAVDAGTRDYFTENKEELLESFDEEERNMIDVDFIKNYYSALAKPGKEADRTGKPRYNLTMKFQRFAGKTTTEVYDLSDLLAAEAENNPELKEQIDDLNSEYYTKLFQSDLRSTLGDTFGTSIKITEANIDKYIPPGTQFIPICKTERWGNYIPEELRKDAKGHGHGLYTQIIKLFIIRHDEYHFGGADKGFNDDDLESDGDDEKVEKSAYKFSDSAKQIAAEKAKVKKQQAVEDDEPEVPKKKKPASDDEADKPAKKPKVTPPEDDDDDAPKKTTKKPKVAPPEDDEEETPKKSTKKPKAAEPEDDDEEPPVPAKKPKKPAPKLSDDD